MYVTWSECETTPHPPAQRYRIADNSRPQRSLWFIEWISNSATKSNHQTTTHRLCRAKARNRTDLELPGGGGRPGGPDNAELALPRKSKARRHSSLPKSAAGCGRLRTHSCWVLRNSIRQDSGVAMSVDPYSLRNSLTSSTESEALAGIPITRPTASGNRSAVGISGGEDEEDHLNGTWVR